MGRGGVVGGGGGNPFNAYGIVGEEFGSKTRGGWLKKACEVNLSKYVQIFLNTGAQISKKLLLTTVLNINSSGKTEAISILKMLLQQANVHTSWVQSVLTQVCAKCRKRGSSETIEAIDLLIDAGAIPSSETILAAVGSKCVGMLEHLVGRGFKLQEYSPSSSERRLAEIYPRRNVNNQNAFNMIAPRVLRILASEPLLSISFKLGDPDMLQYLLSHDVLIEQETVFRIFDQGKLLTGTLGHDEYFQLMEMLLQETFNRKVMSIDDTIVRKNKEVSLLDVAFNSTDIVAVHTLLKFGATMRPFDPLELLEVDEADRSQMSHPSAAFAFGGAQPFGLPQNQPFGIPFQHNFADTVEAAHQDTRRLLLITIKKYYCLIHRVNNLLFYI